MYIVYLQTEVRLVIHYTNNYDQREDTREIKEQLGRLHNTIDDILAAVNHSKRTVEQNESNSFHYCKELLQVGFPILK